MLWIFPYIKRKLVKGKRKLSAWLLWGYKQQIKHLKLRYFAISV